MQKFSKIESHLKGDKVIALKEKKKKAIKENGHRQYLTKLTIGAITKKAAAKKAAPKAEKAKA